MKAKEIEECVNNLLNTFQETQARPSRHDDNAVVIKTADGPKSYPIISLASAAASDLAGRPASSSDPVVKAIANEAKKRLLIEQIAKSGLEYLLSPVVQKSLKDENFKQNKGRFIAIAAYAAEKILKLAEVDEETRDAAAKLIEEKYRARSSAPAPATPQP